MQGANILIGAVLLLFGRRLFWLFVGCIGFIVGFNFATQILSPQQPEWVILLIALGVGLIGALASVFLQRLVVGIAGFFAGAYFLSTLVMTNLPNHSSFLPLIAYVVGGIIGAILTMALLDPALIILSSLAGATAISQNVPVQSSTKGLLFIVLLVIGIVVQAVHYSRTRKRPQPPQEG